jgi:hypothetical protein
VHREAEREVRAAVRAAQHGVQAVERVGHSGQALLHGRLRAEGAEEGGDAHHHERGGHRLGIGDDAARAVRRGVGQHLQGHQRVVGDHLADAVGIDVVLVRAQRLQRLGGVGEHGDLGAAEMRSPRVEIAQRLGQRCRLVRHGEPRFE